MNIDKVLDKAYEKMALKELVNAPVSALQGVSEGDAEKLKDAFKIKTIKQLANLKYVRWAQAIVTLSEVE